MNNKSLKRPSKSRIAMLKLEAKAKKKHKKKEKERVKKLLEISEASESTVAEPDETVDRGATTILGNGPPEENWEDPPNGAFYIEQDTADVFIHVDELGWVQLNGWCPDVGEEDPSEENPEDPMTGDMYVNVLTGDLYYFVEGFGWVLSSGVEGPQGPPGPAGPPGFADVFYAITGKEEQKLEVEPKTISWEIPEFQDTDYQLMDDHTTLRITNCGTEPARYQVQIKLSICRQDDPGKLVKSGVEFYLQEDQKLVPGSLTYAMMPCAGNHSIFINVIIEVSAASEIDLTLEGRSTGSGELFLVKDGSNCWQVVKLG